MCVHLDVAPSKLNLAIKRKKEKEKKPQHISDAMTSTTKKASDNNAPFHKLVTLI